LLELDCVEIVRAVRNIKVITKLLLSEKQQLLLSINNTEPISSEEDDKRSLKIKKEKKIDMFIKYCRKGVLTMSDIKLLNIFGID
jgi:hypothetical protein